MSTQATDRRSRVTSLLAALLLGACTGIPDGVEPVTGFELDRYLGTWYEIARLDHRFERGLSRVTASYAPRDDGGIEVVNRGYDADEGEWREAVGRAYFVDEPDVGRLKVSFFGPFYGGYNVIALDDGYQVSMVSGPTRDYLWILARTPTIPETQRRRLIRRAQSLGFDVDALILVDQSPLADSGMSDDPASGRDHDAPAKQVQSQPSTGR